VDALIFFCGKNVLADGKVVRVAVDQPEGKHGSNNP
jgi:hypothetical protein